MGPKSAPPAPRPSTARLSSPPDEVLQKRVWRAQGARPCPACAQRISPAPALAGGGVAGQGGAGNPAAISCRRLPEAVPAASPARSQRQPCIQRLFGVPAKLCDYTRQTPQSKADRLPVPSGACDGKEKQLSARASSSSAPELLRSASAQGRQWEGRRGDKPPSPAGPVSGPGFLCCSLHTHRSSLNPRNSHKSRANSTCILQLT